MDNCIEFEGDPISLPCKNYEFPNFDNPDKYNPVKFNKFIDKVYGNENKIFKGASPFAFPTDYIDQEQAKTTGYTLKPQQKFVGKFVNYHTNFNGCLVWHNLGSGKCHALDTLILMHGGKIKKVQDIEVGEFVMGDDSTPREVLTLGRGRDTMYEVQPVKGDSFTYNSEHILCLKPSDGGVSHNIDSRKINQKKTWVVDYTNPVTIKKNSKWFETKEEADNFFKVIKEKETVIQIPIKDYIKLPKSTKARLKLYRTGVNFQEQKVPFDPYIFGLWFGDGNSCSPGITNQDSEVIKYLKETLPIYDMYLQYSPSQNHYHYKMDTSETKNPFKIMMKNLNVLNNKHIPDIYKCNSRKVRLEVLAGIIDSDGSYDKSVFEISQKKENMIDDVIYLARSLGFSAYKNIKKTSWTYKGIKKFGTAFRTIISGHLDEIPTKIKRKQAIARKQKKNVLVTGFKIEMKEEDDYYGFTVDKNHRYLLGDFTVTHNTCTSIVVGEALKAYYGAGVDNKKIIPRIIVSVPAQVISQFTNDLKGRVIESLNVSCSSQVKIKGNPQVYQKKEINENADDWFGIGVKNKQSTKVISENLERFWRIKSHQGFINLLYNKDNKPSEILKIMKKPGNLLIIDEVHNLISQTGKLYQKFIKAISFYMHPDNKIILLSATPIYDKPYEIGLTLNLLRPRLFFPEDEKQFNKLFIDEKTNKLKNEDLFKWMVSGYVSYFKGGNPRDFPFKRIIDINHSFETNSPQFEAYLKALTNDLKVNEKNELKGDFVYKKINGVLSKVPDSNVSSYFSKTQYACNTILPEVSGFKPTTKKAKIKRDKIQLINFKKELTAQMDKKHSKKENEEAVLKYIKENYSVKYAYVIRQIIYCEGTVFLFSSFLQYGVLTLAAILEVLGFKEYNPTDQYKNRAGGKSPRFVLWTGEVRAQKDKFSKEVRSNFNSKKNMDGSRIKIVMGTQAVMEGISFANVRNVHIMNPWWNDSRIKQIEARAVRFKSHVGLPADQQYVNIYHHYASLPSYPNSFKHSTMENALKLKKDTAVRLWNLIKMRRFDTITVEQYIQERSNIKKENSRNFGYNVKQSAVDCRLNTYGNIVRLEEYIQPYYGNNKRGEYVTYYENYSKGADFIVKDSVFFNDYRIETFPTGVPIFDKADKQILFKVKKVPFDVGESQLTPSVFKMVVSKKENLVYIPKSPRASTITFDFIMNENINCNIKNISFEIRKQEPQIKELFQITQNTKILWEITRQLNFDIPDKTEDTHHKKIKDNLVDCIYSFVSSLKKDKVRIMATLKKMMFSGENLNKIINMYIKHNIDRIGDYLQLDGVLLNIMANDMDIDKNKEAELIKRSGKTADELHVIFNEVNNYIIMLGD